jgi:glycosyltransferase involved in cell wall biosynthesis
MLAALAYAARVFSVSASLKTHMVRLGAQAAKIRVVGNGVDAGRFRPEDRVAARTQLGIPPHARVLVSVGALVPRKGFHRVIECLPRLCAHFPELVYLMIGGASPEGDMESELRALAARLDVTNRVRFLGTMAPDALKQPLSAADVFVLATANEGWANVFLEAMACGLPVVTTDVGGNREVVCRSDLGRVIPLGDRGALEQALAEALEFSWDRTAIRRYAEDNHWDQRVAVLVDEFRAIAPPRSAAVVPGHTEGA